MRHPRPLSLIFWSLLAHLSLADDAVPVTEIEEFSLLPRCVAVAITLAVGGISASADCDDGDDKVQSCLCSKTKVSKSVAKSISGGVSFGCGDTATADQSSASVIFEKYCDPDLKVDFSMPAKDNVVEDYITEIPGMDDLAPCAASGVSGVVMRETLSRCPEQASLLAPCVCSKDGVADDVSSDLSKSVKSSCSNSDDLTAAMSFFGAYCDMSNGTTSFAKPEGPPGDMTYHITELAQFQSLHGCARTGLSSAVFEQTSGKCPPDEQGLASCVCLKSGIKSDVSTSLKGQVKFRCDSKTADELSSALDVLDLYCSAAEDEVVPTLFESTMASDPPETHTASESVASKTSSSDEDDDGAGGQPVNKTAIIAGAVAGGVIALALLVGLCIFIRRKVKKSNSEHRPAITAPHEYTGTPELTGSNLSDMDSTTGIVAAASPAAESDYYPGKPEFSGGGSVVTGVSPHSPGSYKPYRPPELQGEVAAAEMPSTRPVAEMPSSESIAEMSAVEAPHHGKERPASPMVSKYNKSFGRNSPATVRESNATSPLSPMHTGGSSASRWRQPEAAGEVFEMEANPAHRSN